MGEPNTEYAEKLPYWQTGQTSPDGWIIKAKGAVLSVPGAKILGEYFGSDATTGREAYALAFSIDGVQYKIVWPVMATRGSGRKVERAARIQAATMLYHDVKARAVSARVLGPRSAFFSYMMLPDGRVASQIPDDELATGAPQLTAWTEGDRG